MPACYSDAAVTLYRGDCREVVHRLPEEPAALVLSDLPFGQTRNAWDRPIPFPDLWECVKRVTVATTPIVFFARGAFTAALISSNRRYYRYSWVWESDRSTGFLNAKRAPLTAHHDLPVFYKRLGVYQPQRVPGKPTHAWRASASRASSGYGKFGECEADRSGLKYPRSVLRFPAPHPARYACEKPVELLAYLIRTYTLPSGLVIDLTAGSGTTLEACRETGRRGIGIELTDEGCAAAVRRLDGIGRAEVAG